MTQIKTNNSKELTGIKIYKETQIKFRQQRFWRLSPNLSLL